MIAVRLRHRGETQLTGTYLSHILLHPNLLGQRVTWGTIHDSEPLKTQRSATVSQYFRRANSTRTQRQTQ